MNKKASDDYIYYRKVFTNIKIIRGINELAEHWGMTSQEACTRIVCESVINELKKKKEIEEYKKMK